jgi:large subunit ribosomal protein L22|tara:strand:- start:201 stop:545 length:345 start_codon:yes stop_codon:yes gene_type:complete
MEARSISRYIRQSPKKVRIVLDKIRGKRVGYALDYLHFSPLKASSIAEKTIRSAVANLMQLDESSNLDPDSFIIKEAYSDGGPHLKRFRAASMGRISKLNKPSSHLTIIISDDS